MCVLITTCKYEYDYCISSKNHLSNYPFIISIVYHPKQNLWFHYHLLFSGISILFHMGFSMPFFSFNKILSVQDHN